MIQTAYLPNFPHRIGAHCSSTSVQNVLRYDGVELSEAMVFGLGAGLGFWFIHDESASPTRRFNGRAPDLEGNFYRHIGRPIKWEGRWSPQAMAVELGNGRPIIAQTDIYHLPYYRPQVHFIGHGVVVTAIDLDVATVDIADIHGPEPLTIGLDSFEQAIAHASAPLLWPYHWSAAPDLSDVAVEALATPDAIRRAIATAAHRMLTPPQNDDTGDTGDTGDARVHEGIDGMMQMADSLPTWAEDADFAWSARFGYQAIEKRGTGGGGFRPLYGAFLAEAAQLVPELKTVDGETRMVEIGALWSELANHFKRAFIEEDSAHVAAAASLLRQIAAREKQLMEELEEMVSGELVIVNAGGVR